LAILLRFKPFLFGARKLGGLTIAFFFLCAAHSLYGSLTLAEHCLTLADMRRKREFNDVRPYRSAVVGCLRRHARIELQRSPRPLCPIRVLLLSLALCGEAICFTLLALELPLSLLGLLLLPAEPVISSLLRLFFTLRGFSE
jgi:hypothetical protein